MCSTVPLCLPNGFCNNTLPGLCQEAAYQHAAVRFCTCMHQVSPFLYIIPHFIDIWHGQRCQYTSRYTPRDGHFPQGHVTHACVCMCVRQVFFQWALGHSGTSWWQSGPARHVCHHTRHGTLVAKSRTAPLQGQHLIFTPCMHLGVLLVCWSAVCPVECSQRAYA